MISSLILSSITNHILFSHNLFATSPHSIVRYYATLHCPWWVIRYSQLEQFVITATRVFFFHTFFFAIILTNDVRGQFNKSGYTEHCIIDHLIWKRYIFDSKAHRLCRQFTIRVKSSNFVNGNKIIFPEQEAKGLSRIIAWFIIISRRKWRRIFFSTKLGSFSLLWYNRNIFLQLNSHKKDITNKWTPIPFFWMGDSCGTKLWKIIFQWVFQQTTLFFPSLKNIIKLLLRKS